MKIKNLKLRNFKGLRAFETEFNGENHIFGDNGTGKTTLVDAYHWLLFDKDSGNRSAFNVKTLDENGEPFHNLEHEVEATILHGSNAIVLRKILREKWVKKRGSEKEEFSGHETDYFINDVPKKKGDYQTFIDGLISEDVFKLISSPTYFATMPWTKQREILFAMAGELSDTVLAMGNTRYENLLATIATKQTTITEYNKELANKIRKAKAELETIPARLDEVDRDKPQPKDWAEIERQIAQIKGEIEAVNGSAKAQSDAATALNDKVRELQRQIRELENKKSLELDEKRKTASSARDAAIKEKQLIQDEVSQMSSKVISEKKELERLQASKPVLEQEIIGLREAWHKEEAATPDFTVVTCCPTCNRDFDADKVESERNKALEAYNTGKAARLEAINKKGTELKERLTQLVDSILVKQKDIKVMDEAFTALIQKRDTFIIPQIPAIDASSEYDAEITRLKDVVTATLDSENKRTDEDFTIKRSELSRQLSALELELNQRTLIERADKRIQELNNQQKAISQEIAEWERIQDTITAFNKEKVLQIESKINSMFELVRFKLFAHQINGGEVETCEVMVNGVPWSDLNTASRINAGIDIINALSKHFNTTAPVWIDNRESVVSLINTDAQVINLHVSKSDKQLRIA